MPLRSFLEIFRRQVQINADEEQKLFESVVKREGDDVSLLVGYENLGGSKCWHLKQGTKGTIVRVDDEQCSPEFEVKFGDHTYWYGSEAIGKTCTHFRVGTFVKLKWESHQDSRQHGNALSIGAVARIVESRNGGNEYKIETVTGPEVPSDWYQASHLSPISTTTAYWDFNSFECASSDNPSPAITANGKTIRGNGGVGQVEGRSIPNPSSCRYFFEVKVEMIDDISFGFKCQPDANSSTHQSSFCVKRFRRRTPTLHTRLGKNPVCIPGDVIRCEYDTNSYAVTYFLNGRIVDTRTLSESDRKGKITPVAELTSEDSQFTLLSSGIVGRYTKNLIDDTISFSPSAANPLDPIQNANLGQNPTEFFKLYHNEKEKYKSLRAANDEEQPTLKLLEELNSLKYKQPSQKQAEGISELRKLSTKIEIVFSEYESAFTEIEKQASASYRSQRSDEAISDPDSTRFPHAALDVDNEDVEIESQQEDESSTSSTSLDEDESQPRDLPQNVRDLVTKRDCAEEELKNLFQLLKRDYDSQIRFAISYQQKITSQIQTLSTFLNSAPSSSDARTTDTTDCYDISNFVTDANAQVQKWNEQIQKSIIQSYTDSTHSDFVASIMDIESPYSSMLSKWLKFRDAIKAEEEWLLEVKIKKSVPI